MSKLVKIPAVSLILSICFYKRAIVACAHKLVRIIYAVLRDMKPYYDKGADYEALRVL